MRLSIDRVAEEISVSPVYLKSLEKNNLTSLPPEVYAKGFIRQYCALLKIDEETALFLFEKSKLKNLPVRFPYVYLPFSKIQRWINHRNLILFFSFLLAGVVLVYLFRAILPLYQKPFIILQKPDHCPINLNEDTFVISGKTQPESKIWINGEESTVDKEGNFLCQIFLKEGENDVQIKAINKFGKVRKESCVIVNGGNEVMR